MGLLQKCIGKGFCKYFQRVTGEVIYGMYLLLIKKKNKKKPKTQVNYYAHSHNPTSNHICWALLCLLAAVLIYIYQSGFVFTMYFSYRLKQFLVALQVQSEELPHKAAVT